LEVDVFFRDGYESNSHAEDGYGGYDGLETDDVGSSMKLPSADEVLKLVDEYVAGIDGAGAVGEEK
jgi:hypothetical protein